MNDGIRIIKHEAVPECGSFEVRFPDDRPSHYFYWDDIPARRMRPETLDRETALEKAKAVARNDCARSESYVSFRDYLPGLLEVSGPGFALAWCWSGPLPLGRMDPPMTELIYVDTSKQVGDRDHLSLRMPTPRKPGLRKTIPKA